MFAKWLRGREIPIWVRCRRLGSCRASHRTYVKSYSETFHRKGYKTIHHTRLTVISEGRAVAPLTTGSVVDFPEMCTYLISRCYPSHQVWGINEPDLDARWLLSPRQLFKRIGL